MLERPHDRGVRLRRWTSVALALASPAFAELRLAPVYCDHMVLQRDADLPISGRATPGSAIEVAFGPHRSASVARSDGGWTATLPPLGADATPRELVVVADGGNERVVVRDVLVGDVWLCGGQSNMEWPVAATLHAQEARAVARPTIRALKMPHVLAERPIASADVRWRLADAEACQRVSAVGFFFAVTLADALEVPIGLLEINWGGTRIEPWMRGGQMHQGMIAPIAPFPIRGILWYQGESNAGEADRYAGQLTQLIADWRRDFNESTLPFGIVQLAAFKPPSEDPAEGGWSLLREAQAQVARTDPGVGLVVTLDVGDAADIHPRDKRTVGERLASWALGTTYGVEGQATSGPVFASIERATNSDGRAALRVQFDSADGLRPREGEVVTGFGVAGPDGRFHWAEGVVEAGSPEAPSRRSVLVRCEGVSDPRSVVYAWQNNPSRANLVNGAGLPAGPFRASLAE